MTSSLIMISPPSLDLQSNDLCRRGVHHPSSSINLFFFKAILYQQYFYLLEKYFDDIEETIRIFIMYPIPPSFYISHKEYECSDLEN